MTITYPLSLPTSGIRSIRWTAVDAVGVDRSPFTFDETVQLSDGQMWKGMVTLPPLMEDDGADWAGFLTSLRGSYGTFLLGDPLRTTPRGAVGGSPVIDGVGQTGNTLSIRGASASITGWLKRGDYIQIGSAATATLHMVTADVDTDASGNADLDVWPAMRTGTTDGAAITTSNCVGNFRLAGNDRSWTIDAPWRYGISFAVEEVI